MTLQPPSGYGSGAAGGAYRSDDGVSVSRETSSGEPPVAPPVPARLPMDTPEAMDRPAGVPGAQLGNPDGAWLRVLAREPAAVASAMTGASAVGQPDGGASKEHPAVIPARRRPTPPPLGTNVVGGRTVTLHRVVALDRLASGIGYLTIEWLVRQRGHDLLALHDGAVVSARGNALTVDLTQPLGRVMVATGTQGTMPLSPTELRVSNGATQVIIPIDGGTSLGVWPRLTITRVDEFVVIRHEHDPLSGMLDAVAAAYGYDERNFTLTHTHLLG